MLETFRNLGIIAHVDAGKTTLTERLLFVSGAKHRVGAVEEGTTTTDYDPLEREKGITIQSAAVTLTWAGHRITILDTPGHVDFTAEVERSLRVLDGAVGVFCAVGGVEVQSETVWRQADQHRVPRLAFINKLDRVGADFWGVVQELKRKLQVQPAVCTRPVGQGSDFRGVVDLVAMQFWPAEGDGRPLGPQPIPEELSEEAELGREQLLEIASHACDELLACLVENRPVSAELLNRALRSGTLAGKFVPVLCGSALRGCGMALVLDAIVRYLPSPLERPPVLARCSRTRREVLRVANSQEPLTALAFKTISESHGDCVLVRVYSGELRPGMKVFNASRQREERIGQIYQLMGARREKRSSAQAGEIVAVVGLKYTSTGHTLSDPDAPVLLEEIRFPEPVLSQALHLGKNVEEGKLAEALSRLVRDDPTLRAHTDPETGELLLSGMGELHLEVALHRLRRDFQLDLSVGQPRVAYRQTLAQAVELEYRHIKQRGGRGQYAVIVVRFEPLTPEQRDALADQHRAQGQTPDPMGLYFEERIVGGAIPQEYIPAVAEGFREAARRGVRWPFPFVDIQCTLLDGKHHEVDSSYLAFQWAAQEAFVEAVRRAGVVLLEPIMRVHLLAPARYLGDLHRDIARRRGTILHTLLERDRTQIQAFIPLVHLFGYASDLRNFTSGTATFSMEPDHYAPANQSLEDLRLSP
ncbi:MAG: elongation factor G [Gemmatales bacterium]|nr:elongation factor G [Gemmatales bacterium]MCS7161671.1 elongation factor G [Gemmatales bacterium]MDW8176874.1 elongation factor G [Gemmatales bacterium]MDW8221984.1 elongation factor G [Gemmatales bacterium]